MPASKPYRWLADYYDDFFGASRAPMEAAHAGLLAPILPQVETACDLACGTGTAALSLARRGIETYAVDLSPDMCRLARAKARAAGVPVRVIRADMRSFHLPRTVDLITCEYDAVNHVPHARDLARVAKSAARALRPGGHFFFDVNNSAGFKRYWRGVVWAEKAGVVLVMRNGRSEAADRAWADVEWFIRDGKRWVRRTERVEEVCWTGAEIQRTLKAAGFDRVRSWDAAPFFAQVSDVQAADGEPLVTPGCRTVYLARKRQD